MKRLKYHLNQCMAIVLLLGSPLLSGAAPDGVVQQAGHLRAILAQADDAYFNKHESIMGNAAYDALRRRYESLVARYPELGGTDAVGAVAGADAVPHTQPVLSLKKAYSDAGVEKFVGECGTNHLFCIEPKIDGLTVVLHYRNGVLVRALTRGDGTAGQDVTKAVLAAGCAPPELAGAEFDLCVRGELFLTKEAFSALNARRQQEGLPELKSARNTASGTLRLSDYAEVAHRRLSLRVFEWIEGGPQPDSHTQALALLWQLGFPTVESITVPGGRVVAEVGQLNRRRHALPYGTDGIVVRIDDRQRYTELGATAHHPRGALARKYKTRPIVTQLLRVEWSQGTSGKWTPVAHFAPVEMAGATVRSATLHNEDHLRALDLRIGDWIQVIRAGGAVPEIIGVCTDRRTGTEKTIPARPAK